MQAVQRFEREKSVDGGKKKEEVDDPHTSAAKRKRPLRNGREEDYYYGASNIVMVHIRNLRSKIEEDPHDPKIIRTVWGRGYRCD